MPLALRNIDMASTVGAATTLTVARPSGTTKGDLLVAVIMCDSGADYTLPSGWTQGNTTTGGMKACYKIATGSEPSNYTWGPLGFGSGNWAGITAAFRGTHRSSPFGAAGENQDTSPPPYSAMNVTRTGSLVVALCGGYFGSGSSIGDPAGYGAVGDITSFSDTACVQLAYKLDVAIGSETPSQPGMGGGLIQGYTCTMWFKRQNNNQSIV